MKNWREVKQDFLKALQVELGEKETNSVFRLTMEYFTGNFPPSEADLKQFLTADEQAEVTTIISRLQNHEPIQYILGYAWFYDLQLQVNPNVLIPRQETEELVHWISEEVRNMPRLSILDIGCGSGAIGLALAKYVPDCTVLAGDISSEAVKVASENASRNAIANIQFEEMDMLNLPALAQTFDVIVSNPPYVDWEHRVKMPKNVTTYEPDLALFAPKGDELRFYKAIADFAKEQLSERGFLFFEINEHYKDDVVEMLKSKGFLKVTPKQDINGNWRMVKAVI